MKLQRGLIAFLFPAGLWIASAALAADPAALKAPPPTIADVIAQVRAARSDTSAIEANRALLAQQPAPDLSKKDTITVLKRRATAAYELGEEEARISDLRKIAEMSAGERNEPHELQAWGLAEIQAGDAFLGIEILNRIMALTARRNDINGTENTTLTALGTADIYLGRFEEGEKKIRTARAWFDQFFARPGGWWSFVPHWQRAINTAEAEALALRGKHAEAEAKLRFALQQSEEVLRTINKLVAITTLPEEMPKFAAFGHTSGVSKLSQVLNQQGKVDEAELLLRNALTQVLEKHGRFSTHTATLLADFAKVLIQRARYQEALMILDESEAINRVAGSTKPNLLVVSQMKARINGLTGMEAWEKLAQVGDAGLSLIPDTLKQGSSASLLGPGYGVALIRTKRAEEARNLMRGIVAHKTSVVGEDHYETAELRGVVAMASAALGDRVAALADFERAADILLRKSARSASNTGASAVIRRQILEAYLDTLAESRELGDAAERALRIAEALNLGKTQQALAQSSARAAANNPELAELIRRQQDSRSEQAALYEQVLRLSSLPADKQLPQVLAGMKQRIADIEKEDAERAVIIAQRFPAYDNLINPAPPSLAETRAALRPGEALINLFSTPKATYVWAFRREGPVAFASAPLGREAIGDLVAQLRRSLDPGDIDMATAVPEFDLANAHGLYKDLLLPVAAGWQGAGSLLVAANGALNQIPLALLPTRPVAAGSLKPTPGLLYAHYRQVPWLIGDAAITQLPSINALVTLRKLPAGNPARSPFLGFGDPQFSLAAAPVATTRRLRNLAINHVSQAVRRAVASDGAAAAVEWVDYSKIPPLPDTREEILSVAKAMQADPERDTVLGKEASKANVLKMDLSKRKVIAFATHGLLPNDFPGVAQPSLALANPGDGQHGLLTLEEILGLKLDADWVILSACNTAAGDGAGSDAISGLGRGFFYAGTRSLLVTHWPVESSSARMIVSGTFDEQTRNPSLSRAEALRRSILKVMQSKADDEPFSFAHPIFWAPYVLVGDSGGT